MRCIAKLFIGIWLMLSCTAQAEQPAIVLIIGVDQLRPDRLSEEMPGGLGRLMREGFVYHNATLDHGLTNTCPGHVVMSTGKNPANTGIPGNSYIDHDTMEERYCVDDTDNAYKVHGGDANRSPRAITTSTFGDWLKTYSPESRVYAVSGKDRAAITLGGHQADGVYWYNSHLGRFTSSGYYAMELPEILQAFNGEDFFTAGYGKRFPETWEHGPGSHRPDDFEGESEMNGRVSGHPLNSGEQRGNQFYFSPYLDIATGELARRTIETHQLGQRGVTDYLAVSYSATDVVGHLYGPFSAESEDALAILDEELGVLLDYLDDVVDGNYILALSADHGVMPLPEWMVAEGEMTCPVEGGRINLERMGLSIYWHLYWNFTFPFGNPAELIGFSAAGLTVNARYAAELGVTVDEVAASLAEHFESREEVEAAWTKDELQSVNSDVARLYRNSYVEGKSGHVIGQLKETCLLFRPEGTSHGSPYLYDRAVPLIFSGKGIRSGASDVEAHSIDIAPTLANRLGMPIPDDLDGEALDVWKTD